MNLRAAVVLLVLAGQGAAHADVCTDLRGQIAVLEALGPRTSETRDTYNGVLESIRALVPAVADAAPHDDLTSSTIDALAAGQKAVSATADFRDAFDEFAGAYVAVVRAYKAALAAGALGSAAHVDALTDAINGGIRLAKNAARASFAADPAAMIAFLHTLYVTSCR